MNESIPNNVTAPMPSVTPIINTEPAAVNPLDELAAAIDEFKARLRAMFDESTLLSRKVKAKAIRLHTGSAGSFFTLKQYKKTGAVEPVAPAKAPTTDHPIGLVRA